jgi:hypothetical protein
MSVIQILEYFVNHSSPFYSSNTKSNAVPVYILAGQSNCGRCVSTDMNTTQSALYGSPMNGFMIYNNAYNASNLNTLQAGVDTYLYNPISLQEFGPEVSFSYNLINNSGVKEAYLCKIGVGNTDLATYWIPGGAGEALYKSHLDKTFSILKGFNKTPYFKAFIWMQGENDATDVNWANAYGSNLTTFFKDFDVWIGNKIAQYSMHPSSSAYTKVIGRINGISDPSETYRTTVRTAQFNYCSTGSNKAIMIDTDSYPLRDSVHYNATGQIQFGIDIYNQIKNI